MNASDYMQRRASSMKTSKHNITNNFSKEITFKDQYDQYKR
jgi:hypothetical protein